MDVESIQPPKAFQAEYEGSIPFTRSSLFKQLRFHASAIPTSALLLILTKVLFFVREARRFFASFNT
jgi:hypothetical protein